MSLTSSDIEQDFYDFIVSSAISDAISGMVYKSGMRPINSNLEDVVITFVAGQSNQLQKGILVINTYVPDVIIIESGVNVKNNTRLKSLEAIIKAWLSSFKSMYKIELDRTIQVYKEPDIKQHFINTRLSFKTLIQ